MDDSHLLRILCIHGYRQNEQTFREKTGAFRKIVKKYAELVFITAPNFVPPTEDASATDAKGEATSDQCGWWFSQSHRSFHALEMTDCSDGFTESLDVIRQAFQEQGPFDGVLGFSQGASMVSLLCAMQVEQATDSVFKFEFAILIAGFKSRSTKHADLYTQQVAIPTLHVYGDTDKVIGKDMSVELLQLYVEPVTLSHPGGHFVPAAAPQKKVYVEFLNDMLRLKKERSKDALKKT